MVNEKEFKEIILKDKEIRLNISRVPKKIRQEFIDFAEEEFEGDYGMLLKEIWDKYKEYSNMQQTFDIKLNYIIQLIEQSTASQEEQKPEEKNEITMLSGRKVKGGNKKDGKS